MYSLARAYLQAGSKDSTQTTSELKTPMVDLPAGDVLTPIFNIIEHTQDVDLLAEVASSLAEAVKHPEIAARIAHAMCIVSST